MRLSSAAAKSPGQCSGSAVRSNSATETSVATSASSQTIGIKACGRLNWALLMKSTHRWSERKFEVRTGRIHWQRRILSAIASTSAIPGRKSSRVIKLLFPCSASMKRLWTLLLSSSWTNMTISKLNAVCSSTSAWLLLITYWIAVWTNWTGFICKHSRTCITDLLFL